MTANRLVLEWWHMKVLTRLLDLIAPYDCLGCSTEGSVLCEACATDALGLLPSACFGCAAQTRDFAVCKTCKRKTALTHLWYVAHYEKIAKQLVQSLKFEQRRTVAAVIARYLDDSLPYFDNTVVVPIPTVPRHVRERGFDHAKMIAKEFADSRKLPYASIIVRRGKNRQVGQSRTVRAQQMKGAFLLRHTKLPKNQRILLIDDVVTTGATLGEAARVLRAAGYKNVVAATFALSRLK